MKEESINLRKQGTNGTVCPFLWDRVFIDVEGDVYFCCRKEPGSIGNIRNEKLDIIWHGEKANKFRQLSLLGGLDCFSNCNMINKNELSYKIEPELQLKKIHIEHHEYCNIKCIMCYQKDIKDKRHIDNKIIFRNIDFTYIEEVQLQGGEPLAFKPCIELFKRLTFEYNIPVTIQTNGMLLNEEFIEIIASKSLEIMIALNGATKKIHEMVNSGSKFETVLDNIEKLRLKRDALKSRLRIEGQMTMVRENVHELPDFILLSECLNLDSISISWEKKVPAFLNENTDIFNDIKDRLIQMEFWNKDVFVKRKHVNRLCELFKINNN